MDNQTVNKGIHTDKKTTSKSTTHSTSHKTRVNQTANKNQTLTAICLRAGEMVILDVNRLGINGEGIGCKDRQVLMKKYEIRNIQPIDMFPQTSHVECIVLMTNSGLKSK